MYIPTFFYNNLVLIKNNIGHTCQLYEKSIDHILLKHTKQNNAYFQNQPMNIN